MIQNNFLHILHFPLSQRENQIENKDEKYLFICVLFKSVRLHVFYVSCMMEEFKDLKHDGGQW